HDTLHEMAYVKNPARHRIDCVPEELYAITLAELRSFVRRYYVSRNMFMVVLGPRFKTVERMAWQHFGDWPDRPAPKPDYDMTDGYSPLKETRVRELIRPGIGQHHITVGFPIEEFGGTNHYVLKVLIHILEYLLYDQLQEHKQGVYRNPVDLSQSKWHGLLTVNFATVDSDFVDPGIDAIMTVFKRLRESFVDRDIFQAALHRTFYEWVGPFVNDANQLLESVVDSAANGDEDLVLLHSGRSELEKVTRKKIIDAANQFLTSEFLKVHIKPA
ncbi:MAG: insulinase family protein, partial [Patescibacteria group bacterium]